MVRQLVRHSSYDLVCRAAGILMDHGGGDFDDSFDDLLELTIRRGERLEVTAGLVVALAEISRALGVDE